MRYEIPVAWFNTRAKNKATIPDFIRSDADWIVVEAVNDGDAYDLVVKRLASKRDRRPISGRSYVSKWRADDVMLNAGRAPLSCLPRFGVGDRVILHREHRGHRLGVIVEVLSPTHYGVRLDDYPHVADFSLRELAPFNQ